MYTLLAVLLGLLVIAAAIIYKNLNKFNKIRKHKILYAYRPNSSEIIEIYSFTHFKLCETTCENIYGKGGKLLFRVGEVSVVEADDAIDNVFIHNLWAGTIENGAFGIHNLTPTDEYCTWVEQELENVLKEKKK